MGDDGCPIVGNNDEGQAVGELELGIDLGKWPALKAYQARVAARPAVQAALKAEGLLKAAA